MREVPLSDTAAGNAEEHNFVPTGRRWRSNPSGKSSQVRLTWSRVISAYA